MSRGLGPVTQALTAAGVEVTLSEMPDGARTAAEAARAAGVALDQIVKSILLQGASGRLYLFLTAGSNQVDAARAAGLAGEALQRAAAAVVRDITGFAIGGVAPPGHLAPLPPADGPAPAGLRAGPGGGRHAASHLCRSPPPTCSARPGRFWRASPGELCQTGHGSSPEPLADAGRGAWSGSGFHGNKTIGNRVRGAREAEISDSV